MTRLTLTRAWLGIKDFFDQLTPFGKIIVPLMVAFYAFFAYQAVKGLIFLYGITALPSNTQSTETKAWLVLALIALAFGMAWFKRRWQFWYGYWELHFAVFSTWQLLSSQLTPSRERNALVLLGGLYLMSRGASNCLDGLKDQLALSAAASERRKQRKLLKLEASA